MFAVFTVMRQLRELLWYLTESLTLPRTGPLRGELGRVRERTEHLTDGSPDELAAFDVTTYRQEVGVLLLRVSELVRAGLRHRASDRTGADLIGANLRGADLRGAGLRGAYLIGADLRRADLRTSDLLGADLRAADLRGTGEHLPHPAPARRGAGRRSDDNPVVAHPSRALARRCHACQPARRRATSATPPVATRGGRRLRCLSPGRAARTGTPATGGPRGHQADHGQEHSSRAEAR